MVMVKTPKIKNNNYTQIIKAIIDRNDYASVKKIKSYIILNHRKVKQPQLTQELKWLAEKEIISHEGLSADSPGRGKDSFYSIRWDKSLQSAVKIITGNIYPSESDFWENVLEESEENMSEETYIEAKNYFNASIEEIKEYDRNAEKFFSRYVKSVLASPKGINYSLFTIFEGFILWVARRYEDRLSITQLLGKIPKEIVDNFNRLDLPFDLKTICQQYYLWDKLNNPLSPTIFYLD